MLYFRYTESIETMRDESQPYIPDDAGEPVVADPASAILPDHMKDLAALGYPDEDAERERQQLLPVSGQRIHEIMRDVRARGSTYQDAARLVLLECGIQGEERLAGGATQPGFERELQGTGTIYQIIDKDGSPTLVGATQSGQLPVATYLARYATAPAGAGYMENLAVWINRAVERYNNQA